MFGSTGKTLSQKLLTARYCSQKLSIAKKPWHKYVQYILVIVTVLLETTFIMYWKKQWSTHLPIPNKGLPQLMTAPKTEPYHSWHAFCHIIAKLSLQCLLWMHTNIPPNAIVEISDTQCSSAGHSMGRGRTDSKGTVKKGAKCNTACHRVGLSNPLVQGRKKDICWCKTNSRDHQNPSQK